MSNSTDHRDVLRHVLGRRCDGDSMQAPSISLSAWHKFYRLRVAPVQRRVPFLSRRVADLERFIRCSSNLEGIRVWPFGRLLAAQLIWVEYVLRLKPISPQEVAEALPSNSGRFDTLTRFRRCSVNGCGYRHAVSETSIEDFTHNITNIFVLLNELENKKTVFIEHLYCPRIKDMYFTRIKIRDRKIFPRISTP